MGYRTALLSHLVTLNFLASRSYLTLCILIRDLRQTTWRHGRCTGIGSCTKLWSISIRWDLKHWMRIYLRSKWNWYSGTAVTETCLFKDSIHKPLYTYKSTDWFNSALIYKDNFYWQIPLWVNPNVIRLSKMVYNIAGYKISIVMLYMDSALYNNCLKIALKNFCP